jgi:glycosyltransferase involved in cell wall biosynthesis
MHSEILYVNDGSHDDTLTIMLRLKQGDPRVSILNLSRNYGKEIAMSAGMDYAHGDVVVVMDADLQDPPELIPDLVRRWRDGYDVVYATRTERKGETRTKRLTARVFYWLAHRISHVPIPENTGDFRLLSSRAVDALKRLREQHRFMKGLFVWIGYPQIAVPYQREARAQGKSKWNYWRLWNFAIEGVTSFSLVPLKVSTYFGLVAAGISFFFAVWIVFKTLWLGEPVRGYPTIMVTMLFLGGTQLVAIGILGEYVGRIFNETKNRPLYFVDQLFPSSDMEGIKSIAES